MIVAFAGHEAPRDEVVEDAVHRVTQSAIAQTGVGAAEEGRVVVVAVTGRTRCYLVRRNL
jgi:hypothetical protein